MKKYLILLYLFTLQYTLSTQVNFGTNTTNTDAVTQFVSADSSQGIILPVVSAANRPTCSVSNKAMVIYNLDDSCIQVCNGVTWNCMSVQDTSSFTEGSVIFADSLGRLSEDNKGLFWDNSNNLLKITRPFGAGNNNVLDILDSSIANAGYYSRTFTDVQTFSLRSWENTGAPNRRFELWSAREDGSGNPAPSMTNDLLGAFFYSGYDATSGTHTSLFLEGVVSSTDANTVNADFRIRVKNNGNSRLAGTEAFRLHHDGDLTLNLYGSGNKEASDLSLTPSNYLAGFSTDGTILEIHTDSLEIIDSTTVQNDSVFIHSGVNQYFSGLDDFPFTESNASITSEIDFNAWGFDLTSTASSPNNFAALNLYRQRGLLSSPDSVQAGDYIGALRWSSYSIGQINLQSEINFNVTGFTSAGQAYGNLQMMIRPSNYTFGPLVTNPMQTIFLEANPNRELKLPAYPDTRSDFSTYQTQSLLYTDTLGNLLIAPLDSIEFIDSTTVQNDSVFLHSGVNEYFTGINDIDANHGNILYVSTQGNNGTAEKGNPYKPWEDPWAARDSASSGDLIYVFSGEYDLVSTATGDANLAYSGNNNWYFEPGAIINISGAKTFDDVLFKVDSLHNGNLLVRGGLQINSVIDSTRLIIIQGTNETAIQGSDVSLSIHAKKINAGVLFSLGDTTKNVSVEAEELTTWIRFGYFGSSATSNFKIGSWISRDGAVSLIFAYLYESNINIDIKNITVQKHSFTLYGVNKYTFIHNAFGSIFINSVIKIGIQRIMIEPDVAWGTYRNAKLLATDDRITAHNSHFIFEIDELIDSSATNSPIVYCYTGDAPGDIDNYDVTVNIKKGDIVSNRLFYFDANRTLANNDVNFNFNCGEFKSISSLPIFDINRTPGTTSSINIAGNYTSFNAPVLNIANQTNQRSNVYVTNAKFETINNTNIEYNKTDKLFLTNVKLINDGTVAPIESSSAVNASCMGVYANSLTVDPNVTERVQPIIRDAYVR